MVEQVPDVSKFSIVTEDAAQVSAAFFICSVNKFFVLPANI